MAVTFLTNEDEVRILKAMKKAQKKYAYIATITVAPDAEGNLPQHVVFSADKNGKAFSLTDFFIKAYASFVDGNNSTLYMNVNNNGVIANGTVESMSTVCRCFGIMYRTEQDGYKRVEYTASASSDSYYNPQLAVSKSRLIPPMAAACAQEVNTIDLFTLLGNSKAWSEGSTFELWGVYADS